MSHAPQLAEPAGAYLDAAAIDQYSTYRLFPEESYFFAKYFRAGDNIADLGCGIGRTTLRLHEMGCRPVGLDLSRPFIDLARQRFPYLDFRHASFTDTGLAARGYDHVLIAFNGLDCAAPLAEREAALAEAARIIRPGGMLLYSSHNLRSLLCSPKYPGLAANLWRARHYLKGFRDSAYLHDPWDGGEILYTTRPYVANELKRHGFALVESVGLRASTGAFWIDYLSPYIHYAARKSG